MKKTVENKNTLLKSDHSQENINNRILADNILENTTESSSSDYIYFRKIVPSHSPSFSPSALTDTAISLNPSSLPSAEKIPLTIRSCPGQTSDLITNNFVKLTIQFNYEIVTAVGNSNFDNALKTLENRILDDIATSFLSCGNRRTMMDTSFQFYKDNIVLINSAPNDVIDINNGKI